MATADQNPFDISCTAGASLTASQFLCVEGHAGSVTVNNAQGEVTLGILQNKPASGAQAQVRVGGTSKAVCGASVTAGVQLTTGAAGKVELAATGDNVIGIALQAGDTNDVIAILVRPSGIAA